MTILLDVCNVLQFYIHQCQNCKKSAACIAKSAIWQQGFELVIQNLCLNHGESLQILGKKIKAQFKYQKEFLHADSFPEQGV
jgi:hypothetical protein